MQFLLATLHYYSFFLLAIISADLYNVKFSK